MLVGQLQVVFPQVLQQVLGVLGQESIDIGGASTPPNAPQVAVEALTEAGEHQGPQVLVLQNPSIFKAGDRRFAGAAY